MDKTPAQWMIEPLRRYAQFSGRARRAEYWWFILFGVVIGLAATIFDLCFGLTTFGLNTFASLALFIPQMSVGFRRLHDTDRSGWWFGGGMVVTFVGAVCLALVYQFAGPSTGMFVVIGLAAIVLLGFSILLLVWFCTGGTTGRNRFGSDPFGAD